MPLERPGRPSLAMVVASSIAFIALMGWLRLAVYPQLIVPLTYALPLLVCLWHRNRVALWTMAVAFVAMATYKFLVVIGDASFDHQSTQFVFLAMQWANILIAAGIVHAVIVAREQLETANERLTLTNAELEASNEELASREEEITRQNEELVAQTEELEQQSEELRVQAEELQSLNVDLGEREKTLAALLRLSGPDTNENELLNQICSVAPALIGEALVSAAVLVLDEDQLIVQAHCGTPGVSAVGQRLPRHATLAGLVIEQDKTGQLADTALRPDLQFPAAGGGDNYRSVLSTPLRIAGKATGALELYSSTPHEWTPRQASLVEWLAAQCARAWETIRLRDQLERLNRGLESKVAERTDEVRRRSDELRVLASQLTTAEHRERRRLAQVLHDDLQQMLVAAQLRLGMPPRGDGEAWRAEINQLIGQAVSLSRTLTVELSPPILFEEKFETAVRWLARRFQQNHGLAVDVDIQVEVEPSGDDWRIFLFNAINECLFNVVKHAGIAQARVVLDCHDGDFRVTVEDQGSGFAAGNGHGGGEKNDSFGLFSLRQRAQLLGGTTTVVSIPGSGTRVEITAPLAAEESAICDEAAAAVRPITPRPRANAGEENSSVRLIRVVLADDHRILRDGLVSLLREQPSIEVVGEADDGVAAVELAVKCRPHVVVMDISMPRMNGIEATRTLRTELPGVKVIAMSMHESDEIATAMREAGAVDYVTKGGPADQLIDAIHRAAALQPA